VSPSPPLSATRSPLDTDGLGNEKTAITQLLILGPLSGGSRAAKPICESCASSICAQASDQVTAQQHYLDQASTRLKSLLSVPQPSLATVDVLRMKYEAEAASAGSAAANSALLEALEEERKLANEEALVEEETLDWRSRARVLHEARSAVMLRLDAAQRELDRLSKTAALNDAFHVWEDGHYGTISGLRLGRAPSASNALIWEECSAALGEASLLLNRLASLTGFAFASYELIPLGPRSWIRCHLDSSVDQLHLVRDDTAWVLPGRRADVSSFNRALIGFTVCLKELCDQAKASQRGKELDIHDKLYPVKAEQLAGSPLFVDASVNGLSIQTDTLADDGARWTEACKYLACNIKWLCVCATAGHSMRRGKLP